MIKNRLVAAGAAAALATGTALMAVPAHAATPAPAPTPAPSAPAKPGINVSKLPIHIDFDCLKKKCPGASPDRAQDRQDPRQGRHRQVQGCGR
ncbi:hypothetical protein JCM18916_1809 [Cutibacterium acnes JCM 18916]|nr:hypothetical protein JCM18916_1809 [Cutibacterium acnes JCM 18916]